LGRQGEGGDMYKRIIPELDLKVQFGSKGVFHVRGIPRTIGKTQNGELWFSILICKPYIEKRNGIPLKGYHYVEQTFYLSQVTEGKEKILPYFEDLK
jgi:hypothetical protein